jgi:hypothetical protein
VSLHVSIIAAVILAIEVIDAAQPRSALGARTEEETGDGVDSSTPILY